ncbi:hypothetical protein WMY93_024747 [Mugilogobius chulae]|uniref:THAP-type domain-containing protein n=1 Tax=Mugilogobius chulae TaxID=88201 RepID=A0AAW0N4Y5_9GOBI
MPKFCSVYGCANRSNREKDKLFFCIPKVVTHKGERFRLITEKRRKKWLENLNLKPGGRSDNGRVCSDHFKRGCPSLTADVTSPDWAPSLKLGYERTPNATADDGGEFLPIYEKVTFKTAACQTDMSMRDLTRLEKTLKDTTSEMHKLRKRLLDNDFTPQTLEGNDEKIKFYTGLPISLF